MSRLDNLGRLLTTGAPPLDIRQATEHWTPSQLEPIKLYTCDGGEYLLVRKMRNAGPSYGLAANSKPIKKDLGDFAEHVACKDGLIGIITPTDEGHETLVDIGYEYQGGISHEGDNWSLYLFPNKQETPENVVSKSSGARR